MRKRKRRDQEEKDQKKDEWLKKKTENLEEKMTKQK